MGISNVVKKLHDSIKVYVLRRDNIYEIRVISNEKIDEEFPDGTMKDFYKRSIVMLKKYIDANNHVMPGAKEWNKYAKENNCLSSVSLKYMSGINLDKNR